MPHYKATCTLNWQIEDKDDLDNCLKKVREKVRGIIPRHDLHGVNGVNIQLELTPMKTKKLLKHIEVYSVDEILDLVTKDEQRIQFIVNGEPYLVRMDSERYHLFKTNRFCASCGIEGVKMILDMCPGYSTAHFNLYAEEDNQLVLMTKDHKIPRSKGGKNTLENYVTCCCICNGLKGNYEISYEQIKTLRQIYRNEDCLPSNKLKAIIQKTRDKMVKSNFKNIEV